ncbi:MAG TPA: class I SAM-dependent methyltransferase [Gammaproteobacteria bacterium]
MQLADAVRKYDAASRHYDRFMDVVFGKVLDVERYRERVVGLLGNLEGKTVIDIGCGTGRNFPLLVKTVGPRGRVVGLDCSAGMLAEARRRVERHGWHNVELVRGDAVALDGVDEPVDAVLSVWCYGTVYDLAGALRRATDVLRPGGRIAIMTFVRASPERGPLRWLYPLYRFAVRCAGIDPARDFDNAALAARWQRGREILRGLLWDLHEERYLQGAGLIIAGRKPLETARAAAAPARAAADAFAAAPAPGVAPLYAEQARNPGSA